MMLRMFKKRWRAYEASEKYISTLQSTYLAQVKNLYSPWTS